jgi:hypothetical protein
MRFYRIILKGADNSIFPTTPDGSTWSSHPWGGDTADPGAQEIELDITMLTGHEPSLEACTLTVKGVSWKQISEPAKLVGKHIEVYAGMKPGLPLATVQSRHTGLLASGEIMKSWGNWERNEMSLGVSFGSGADPGSSGTNAPDATPNANDTPSSAPPASAPPVGSPAMYNRIGPRSIDRRRFPVGPGGPTVTPLLDFGNLGSLSGLMSGLGINVGGLIPGFFGGGIPGLTQPLNLVHNLLPNMPLSQAIRETLTRAFPKAKILIGISPGLKLNHQDAGMYQNMKQYGAFLQNLSQSILGVKNYPGIKMSAHGNSIRVTDFTTPMTDSGNPADITAGSQVAPPQPGLSGATSGKDIAVADLLGQPTWVNINEVHMKCVLRPDILMLDTIALPPNILMGLGSDSNILNPFGASEQRTHLSFSGSFQVIHVQHVGAFRSPVGDDWVTNYHCTPVGGGGGGGGTPGGNGTPSVNPSQQGSSDGSTSPAAVASMITKSNYAQDPFSAPSSIPGRFGSVVLRTARRY